LIEVLLVAAISSVIVGILFYAMNAGNLSFNLSSARADLQAEVRRSMDWIVKDVRQTTGAEIASNNPTDSKIKFRVCQGHDGSNLVWSSAEIEYSYYSNLKRLPTQRD